MPTQTISQTTKSFVEVSEIRDSVVILKNGSMRAIIEVGSTNLALKSPDEQMAIIGGFQEFLNSMDFPLQILVHSRKLNIDGYIALVDTLADKLDNELLRIQAKEYSRFIKGLTELSDIMAKKFYIVVPFYTTELQTTGTNQSITERFKSIFKPSAVVNKQMDEQKFEAFRLQLDQRVDLVMSSIMGMGLTGQVLAKEDLFTVFRGFYNPDLKSLEESTS